MNRSEIAKRPPFELPPGVKLLRRLEGHADAVYGVAFDPTGRMLASGSADRTVKVWDVDSGKLLRTLEGLGGTVYKVVFDPTARVLACGGPDGRVMLWKVGSGKLVRTFGGVEGAVYGVAFDPAARTLACGGRDGRVELREVDSGKLLRTLRHTGTVNGVEFDLAEGMLASASDDNGVKLWDPATGDLLCTLDHHALGLAFDPTGQTLASGGRDATIKLWEAGSGKLLRILEDHVSPVTCVAFSRDGLFLASNDEGNSVRIWRRDTWDLVANIAPRSYRELHRTLAIHPTLPVLATVGSSIPTQGLIYLWEFDVDILLGRTPGSQLRPQALHYVNAKVVVVGDTGVGKTGLSLVLNGQPFEATDSTPGRHVWTFGSCEVELPGNRKQTRETLLWDLAGQPGYRVIHQLHLNEIAVALVVFDARSEIDPLAGVRHWERALRLAQQRQGAQAVPLRKFLVSARTDRGGVSVSKERLDAFTREFGFDGYFETSAKEGWQVEELKAAVEQAITWYDLPVVTSSELFASIKAFLLEAKKTGRLLVPADQLFDEFARKHPKVAAKEETLRAQFDTCIGRLENRDLIRRLSFGGYVLLQPELLDAYASAMVVAAKSEPEGLGSIAEDVALAGRFHVPEEQKVKDRNEEQLLLHATVQELVEHDLALRESAADGRYLVFPSQFNRDYEDAPEPPGKTVAMTFEGPVQSLYSTLAVRLSHSALFETARIEMWRNATVFTARAGGKCGIYLHEFAEARGRLLLFFDTQASDETRFHFEEYVLAHLNRRALDGTVEVIRFFVCPSCSNPVPDAYVKMLRSKGEKVFNCPCTEKVSLADPKEKLATRYPSQVEAMERAADRRRDFEAFVVSAKAETHTPSFVEWAGGERVTLAIAFTDVVGSTALGEEIKDERMNEVRRAYFAQSRKLIVRHMGREVKTIGDSFMAAFHSVGAALDYARALQSNPGHPQVQVRSGIHIGAIQVEESDVFGSTVNFAARVVGVIKDAEIWLSDRAKVDIDGLGAGRHKDLKWKRHDEVAMKGFPGTFTLWSLLR